MNNTTNLSQQGYRPAATRLPVSVNDVISGSVDVGTGNLNLSIRALGYGFSKNSLDATETGHGVRDGWRVNVAGAGSLNTNGTQIIWTRGDGYEIPFVPVAGSTTQYTAPAYLRSTLVKTQSGWDLRQWDSNTITSFNNDGNPIGLTDRNGNKTSITPTSSGVPASVTGWRGPVTARTVKLEQAGAVNTVTVGGQKVTLTSENGRISSITALNGSTTKISYNTEGRVAAIEAPLTGKVSFSYDSLGRLISFTKANTQTGDQTTRLDYSSPSQTLVAESFTDQAQAVSVVPHITYTLNASKLVTAARDADGRVVSRTFTGNLQTASSTQGEGADAATTTNAFNANGGYSQTGSTSPTGAGAQASYGNTTDATRYSPTSSTDDAGNKSTYTYSAAGNMESATTAMAATAKLTYNPDGTVATATAPGQDGNPTTYTYNADHQLIKVTPNTGGSLKAESYTYDSLGRLSTRVNGRGQTITYTYDQASRLVKVSYSDGTTPVVYEYNERNQVTKRTDASGTSTMTYDQQGRLKTRSNSLAQSTITYNYDKGGRLAGKINGPLNDQYVYSPGGKLTELRYTDSGASKKIFFTYNNRGQRVDTVYGTGTAAGQWNSWSKTAYDASGKTARTSVQRNSGAGVVTVLDRSYCYMANTTAATGCTASASNDRVKLQWVKDNLNQAVTTYAYDKQGRLLQSKTAGGNNLTYAYTYDARGNRLTGTVSGRTVTSQFNAQNQMVHPDWAYDADGNAVAETYNTSKYNAANQMTSVYQKSQKRDFAYTYAGTNQNEMVRQEAVSGTYTYSYGRADAHGVPVIEKIIKDGSTAYVEHDPTTGRPMFIRLSDGTVNEYATDAAFSEMYLLSDTGEEAQAKGFDPFGVRVVNSKTDSAIDLENPYQYRFGVYDRLTGRYRYGARQYNWTYAIWVTRDSLDSPLDHANANRYAYAGQDPVNNYDPTGLRSFRDWVGDVADFAGAGAALGGIGGCYLGAVATAGAGCVPGATAGAATGAILGGATGLGYVALEEAKEFSEDHPMGDDGLGPFSVQPK